MKHRKNNIMLSWWPGRGWTVKGNGWIVLDDVKTFRTLKAARRYARYLLLDQQQDEVEFWRRVPGGWAPETVWERTERK